MNDAEQKEAHAAERVIQTAQYYAAFWVAFSGLDEQDREAATLGILRAAVEKYAERIGVNLNRLNGE